MPGVLVQPNLRTLPSWITSANIADDAIITRTIGDNQVTLENLIDLANATVLGRNTAGTGDPEAVSMAQLATLMRVAAATTNLVEVSTVSLTITPITPGNWSFTYTQNTATCYRFANFMLVLFDVGGTSNAYTTAAGQILIEGLPASWIANNAGLGSSIVTFTGIITTDAAGEDFYAAARPGQPQINFLRQAKAASSGIASMTTAHLPASRTIRLTGGVIGVIS